MKIHGYRLMALIRKDIHSLLGNRNILLMSMLPLIFAIAYKFIFSDTSDMPPLYILLLCEVLNLSAIPSTAFSMMIAEEKEKNTLRTLLLTGITAAEFLLSKMLVILIFMITNSIIIFFITEADMGAFALYVFVTTIISIAVLFFGGSVGLLAKDQMATGTYSAPVMLLLMMPPLFAQMNDGLSKFANLIPTSSFMNLMTNTISNTMSTGDVIFSYGVIAVWIILGLLLFVYIYKKKGMDN